MCFSYLGKGDRLRDGVRGEREGEEVDEDEVVKEARRLSGDRARRAGDLMASWTCKL